MPRIEAARNSDDLAAVSRLAGVIWRAHYPGVISDAQIEYMLGMMYAQAKLEDDRARGVVYELLKDDCGALIGFMAHEAASERGMHYLHKLYIDVARHGAGLGKMLVAHFETVARTSGAKALELHVNRDNAKSIAFYERLGFRVTAEEIREIGAGFVMDDLRMRKDLAR